jgi:hypothetical protein
MLGCTTTQKQKRLAPRILYDVSITKQPLVCTYSAEFCTTCTAHCSNSWAIRLPAPLRDNLTSLPT